MVFFKLIQNTILFTEFDSVFSSHNFATIFGIKESERHMHMHTCTYKHTSRVAKTCLTTFVKQYENTESQVVTKRLKQHEETIFMYLCSTFVLLVILQMP
jgi:hypothetical protein